MSLDIRDNDVDALAKQVQQSRSKGWADVLARKAVIPQQQRGYLRDLIREAGRGKFSLGPMLMALMRANGASGRKVS